MPRTLTPVEHAKKAGHAAQNGIGKKKSKRKIEAKVKIPLPITGITSASELYSI
jgi:hypothetical protein